MSARVRNGDGKRMQVRCDVEEFKVCQLPGGCGSWAPQGNFLARLDTRPLFERMLTLLMPRARERITGPSTKLLYAPETP